MSLLSSHFHCQQTRDGTSQHAITDSRVVVKPGTMEMGMEMEMEAEMETETEKEICPALYSLVIQAF